MEGRICRAAALAALLVVAYGCTPAPVPGSGHEVLRATAIRVPRLSADSPAAPATTPPPIITPSNLADTMVALDIVERQKVKSTFHICRYEVTQSLWEAVMGSNPAFSKGPELPVERVSWKDIQDFLERLNAYPDVKAAGITYRLPTEAEWKLACGVGTTNDYGVAASGLPGEIDDMGWYKGNSGGHTHGIGLKAPNVLGLYDLHGNVREWTASSEGFFRVIRGGGCRDIASWCTASKRIRFIPEIRNDDLGFRLAY